ncbi:hypothetical protein [Mycobacterium sp.]|uniref:hypothetical protein n=3 Tax=Mycobacterium sp. TaxID=1785 RepID=UPI0031E40A87
MGAAVGGLLGAASLPVAVADDYTIVADPDSIEAVTGIYEIEGLTLPVKEGSVQGQQLFDVDNTTVGSTTSPDVVGIFDADEATVPSSGGYQVILVTSDLAGTPGAAAGDVPPVGSVFATVSLGHGFENVYSDLASTTPGGDVISDTLVTPFGQFSIPIPFDAAAGIAADSLSAAFPVAGGYDIVPDPASTEKLAAIAGVPPLDVTVGGYERFDLDGPTAATGPDVVGTFDTEETDTSDIFGNYTQALLVTADVSGTPGTAAGDVPPVGSVFNTLSSIIPGVENVYSDLASTTPGGDVISDVLVTPFGQLRIPMTFDAAAGIATDSLSTADPVAGGDEIVPDPASNEQFTGINGLPPLDVVVQGHQLFDVDAAGTQPDVVGTFAADEANASDIVGISTRTLLVTSDLSGTAGTAAGDVPAVGSMFETLTLGDSGFGNVYSDLASTTPGADVISDTLVTPFGDFAIPSTLDPAAVLADDSFVTLP